MAITATGREFLLRRIAATGTHAELDKLIGEMSDSSKADADVKSAVLAHRSHLFDTDAQ